MVPAPLLNGREFMPVNDDKYKAFKKGFYKKSDADIAEDEKKAKKEDEEKKKKGKASSILGGIKEKASKLLLGE